MRRRLLLLLSLSLLATPAAAGPRAEPRIAVWPVDADDEARAAGHRLQRRLLQDATGAWHLDDRARWMPDARPTEGRDVAVATALRWQESAWRALRGGEADLAASLAREARAAVQGFPDHRLPEALRRDLHLLEARAELAAGNEAVARRAARAALLLHPGWQPRHGDDASFAELISGLPPQGPSCPLLVRTEPFADVLVHGVRLGRADAQGELALSLPSGLHEVAARAPGRVPASGAVQLLPGRHGAVELPLEPGNHPAFVEDLGAALTDPAGQRGAAVWLELEEVASALRVDGVLAAGYDAETRCLRIGLFLKGRPGWAWYRRVQISLDPVREALALKQAGEALAARLEARFDAPVFASR